MEEMLKAVDVLGTLLKSMKEKYPDFIQEIKKTKDYKEICYYGVVEKNIVIPDLDQVEIDLAEEKISDYIASERVFTVSHELGHVTGAILIREGFKNVPLTDFIRAIEEIVAEGISGKFREKYCGFETAFNFLNTMNYQNSWYRAIKKVIPDKGKRLELISKIRDLINEGYFILEMAIASKSQLEVEADNSQIEMEEDEDE